jgi:ABC-type dipeptide/oligopeptide/nickel transport system permease subunit
MNRRVPGARVALAVALAILATIFLASLFAPEFVEPPNLQAKYLKPLEAMNSDLVGPKAAPGGNGSMFGGGAQASQGAELSWKAVPFGTDERGIPILDYALQGAKIVLVPSLVAGLMIMLLATAAGLIRCAGVSWFDGALQGFSEVVGALPRLVVVLVVAIALPAESRGLMAIALTWAILAAPGAMDEAAATAGRLGGAAFVEALRAHGFGAWRTYVYHIVFLNLRPVIVRQAAEVTMQVVFLEIALSYLAQATSNPAFTHSDSTYSWAYLLYRGYTALLGQDLMHALFLGLGLVAVVAVMAQALRLAARAR